MGRGRAKAKQAKIARELKYFSPQTDLTQLQRELGGQPQPNHDEGAPVPSYTDDGDDAPAN